MSLPPPVALRVIAPIAALVYPALVWGGTAISPICLVLALGVPALGLVAGHSLGRAGASQLVRAAAYAAVAAPPLFALLGGWFDFQRALPFGSVGIWLPLWGMITLVAVLDRRVAVVTSAPSPRWLVVVHASSAIAIALFAVVHVANHVAGLFGGDVHVAIMHGLRRVYRHQVVEPVLLATIFVQISTGLALLWRRMPQAREWFATLQIATGTYLMMFLASHVSAVFRARVLRNRDTDWTWLGGGELLTDPWSARLVPYYFLAVIALSVHVACGLRVIMIGHGMRVGRGNALVVAFAALATLASSLILAGLFRA
jgi:succinate dehydrogenase/fumarate reductase cytochrome b subunit